MTPQCCISTALPTRMHRAVASRRVRSSGAVCLDGWVSWARARSRGRLTGGSGWGSAFELAVERGRRGRPRSAPGAVSRNGYRRPTAGSRLPMVRRMIATPPPVRPPALRPFTASTATALVLARGANVVVAAQAVADFTTATIDNCTHVKAVWDQLRRSGDSVQHSPKKAD